MPIEVCVCIAKARCPQGHVLFAMAAEGSAALTEMKLHCDIQHEMHKRKLYTCPRCDEPIKQWRVDTRQTRYRTLDEADTALKRLARTIV